MYLHMLSPGELCKNGIAKREREREGKGTEKAYRF